MPGEQRNRIETFGLGEHPDGTQHLSRLIGGGLAQGLSVAVQGGPISGACPASLTVL